MTRKLILSATLATLVATAAAGTALAADGRGMGMGDRGRDGHPGFGMLLPAIVAALAVLATWLVIPRRPPLATARPARAALQPSPTASAAAHLAARPPRRATPPHAAREKLRNSPAPPTTRANSTAARPGCQGRAGSHSNPTSAHQPTA